MKIAIVRLSAIGDIIQSMVVLQFIKKHYPYSSIDWFVDSRFDELLTGCDELDQIIKLDIQEIKLRKSIYSLFKVIKKIRNLEKYDVVIDLQGLLKSALITRLIPSKERIGFDRNSIREKPASNFYSIKYHFPYSENVIRRYLGLVSSYLKFAVDDEEIMNKKSFFNLPATKLKNLHNIVIVLGASFNSKIYPVERYAEIIENFNADYSVLWYSENELKIAKKLQSKCNRIKIVNCQTFSDLKKLINNSSLVIGGDTGPTHLAWALNKPSITIFGSTPMNRNCFITEKNLALSPGNKINPFKIDKNDQSISQVEPAEIINLIKRLL